MKFNRFERGQALIINVPSANVTMFGNSGTSAIRSQDIGYTVDL